MVDSNKDFKKRVQKITFKALKATLKGVVFYAIYFVLSMFLTSVSEIVPGFQQMIETFVMVYIFLIIVGELASGTVFQHFFNAAKALFVILYLIFSLKSGIMGITFQNVNLIVDLRLFLIIAMLLSLLGFAKSILQTINFLNEKTDHSHI